jgi:hypothetical protein
MLFSCKVLFVDTDTLPAPDSRVGDLVQNEVEANLVFQVESYTLIDTIYRLFLSSACRSATQMWGDAV